MENTNTLLENLRRYVALEEQDEKQFLAITKLSRVKKRQFLVQPGFVCTDQIYVVKGALRSYLVAHDGSELTVQFAIEDWFISDFNSYIFQTPASLYVEALEDSVVLQFSYQDTEQLCTDNPKFERYFRMVSQKAFAFAQKRILSNLGKNSQERFAEFNERYPEIVRRVPQYQLASYLGMTPEFLSRIRSKAHQKT